MSVDLSTKYLGLALKNPLVISACPLTQQLDSLRRLEEAGASAAVLGAGGTPAQAQAAFNAAAAQ